MKRIARAVGWVFLVYIVLSVLVILPLLNFLPPWFVKKTYQRDFSTELVIFNPFTLALEVRDARLSEPGGDGEFAALDRAAVNLSTASLWRPGWVLDELAVEGIDVHLRRFASGDLNIDDLLQPPGGPAPAEPEPPAQEEAPGELPGVTVDRLSLSAHRIRVTDEQRATPYSTHWDDLRIALHGLSTVMDEDHPLHLRVSGEAGGSLEWQGDLSVPAGHSAGEIRIDQVRLRPFWRYLKDQLELELRDGRLYAGLRYELDWTEGFSFRLSDGVLGIDTLDLAPAAPDDLPDTGIQLTRIEAGGIAVDSQTQEVAVSELRAEGLVVSGWMEGDRVSLAEMFRTHFPPSEEAETESESPWRVRLDRARVEAARVDWRSPFTEPAALAIDPLNIAVDNIRWPAEGPSGVAVDLAVNNTATAGVAGELNLIEGDGELNLQLQGLPLAWFAPNLPDALNARIGSGAARTAGKLSLAGFAPRQVTLDGAVEDFSVRLYETEESLTGWKALEWDDLAVDLPRRRVELAQLLLDSYSGRIHIREDGSLNIQHVLREDAAAQADSEAPSEPGEAEAERAQKAEGEEIAEAEAGTGTGTEETAEPWTFTVPAIYISDSEVDFMDESLPINFRTVIGDVDGEITGLDSDPAKSLAVDITGSVDGYAPVTLKGGASPLREPPALDLGLGFQGVDLARLTPYSGTYAGYAIDRGTLNLDVQYSLEDNRLQGDNKVVIRQLRLGEKVESDKALDIPLQLGIALLTDASGVIDLAVPVSGNVDKPEFSLGSVIWGAFANLITKAVTAPFSLLANLVGSEEDLQQVTFAAGGSDLDEPGRAKLRDLAEALEQRPRLKLVITGRLNPETDRAKLQQALLRESLLARGLGEADIDNRSEAWAAAIGELYHALPAAVRGEGTSADGEEAEPPSAIAQARLVSANTPVPPAALKALAEERAAQAKRFLANEAGVAPDRAVIAQTDPDSPDNTFSGVELSVDT